MELIQKNSEKIVLRTSLQPSLLNAIRRSVEEIPTLAVEEVEIFKNDSALYDEVLAHRIGLVPLKTEARMNSKTSIPLTLKKSGPRFVYSGDFKGDAKIVYDEIPLTLLEKDQEIELIATATINTGLSHTKHVPGLMYYRHLQEVKSGNASIDSIVQAVRGVIKPEKKGSKWICDLTDAQIDEIRASDKEAIADSSEIIVFVESFGMLDADKIFTHAIEALQENIELFEKSLK